MEMKNNPKNDPIMSHICLALRSCLGEKAQAARPSSCILSNAQRGNGTGGKGSQNETRVPRTMLSREKHGCSQNSLPLVCCPAGLRWPSFISGRAQDTKGYAGVNIYIYIYFLLIYLSNKYMYTCVCMYIYIYIYTLIYTCIIYYKLDHGFFTLGQPRTTRSTLLTLLDSNFPGHPLWAWESHPFKSRLCLSQTL